MSNPTEAAKLRYARDLVAHTQQQWNDVRSSQTARAEHMRTASQRPNEPPSLADDQGMMRNSQGKSPSTPQSGSSMGGSR